MTVASPILRSCHACGLLVQASERHECACPRCRSPLHKRKVNSLSRTWALMLAAYILYIPANLLPIMQTSSLTGSQSDTIMSGIIYLWVTGSVSLAIVVFVASILVPLLKLFALTVLVVAASLRSPTRPRQRTRLYRLIESIGRWSMLDIFVMTLLVSLVQLKSLASVHAQPGAIAFASVVVLTMLASMSFDPRLLWDAARAPQPANHPPVPSESPHEHE